VAWAVALLLGMGPMSGWSAPPDTEPEATPQPALRSSSELALPVGGPLAVDLPVYFEADNMEGTSGDRTRATGAVRLKRGDLTLKADEVSHTKTDNQVQALGHVQITRRGDVFSGPELTLKLDTLTGEFINPTYRFAKTAAGGQAEKIEFLGPNRVRALGSTYSSCTPSNTGETPDWVLSTSSVTLDSEINEGRAENAVVRFMGVPILAAPVLTFPLTEARKSGFLPPSFDVDSKSGFEFAQPYYWNIAPNRDATITPSLSTRRGLGLAGEYRYLYTQDAGTLKAVALPNDRVADRQRGLLDLQHQGSAGRGNLAQSTHYDMRLRRVSDDDYWKDFPRGLNEVTLTPRLLDSHLNFERQINTRAWGLGPNQSTVYARIQGWQTLKDLDPEADPNASIISPYRREPQVGLSSRSTSESGMVWGVQGEFNRFTNEDRDRIKGNRVHAIAHVERTFGEAAWHVTPKLSVNAASYSLDADVGDLSKQEQRIIPTVSLDSGMVFERNAQWFGRDLIQTLEPRMLYVYTPFRDQAALPLFDSAPRDFNQYSIFSENAFTGVDRVSDANQLNLGLSTRLIDPNTGAETLRLGIVQKVLFADQRITPDDGAPITQRLSDLLLLGSTSVIPHWSLDATLQYSAQNSRVERSLLGARYSPGPWRTISANYRYSRENSEQVDLGWQWPLYGNTPPLTADGRTRHDASCGGAWYSVGKLSYSVRDRRLSNGLLGFEYDGGCWITRILAEQSAVGNGSSTRLLFQLELIGLSRLGTGALRTLTNNIVGYRPLRDENNSLIPGASTESNAYDD